MPDVTLKAVQCLCLTTIWDGFSYLGLCYAIRLLAFPPPLLRLVEQPAGVGERVCIHPLCSESWLSVKGAKRVNNHLVALRATTLLGHWGRCGHRVYRGGGGHKAASATTLLWRCSFGGVVAVGGVGAITRRLFVVGKVAL